MGTVYPADPQINLDGSLFHKACAKCKDCSCQITLSNFAKCETSDTTILLCKTHYLKRFKEEGNYLGDEKFAKHRRMPGSGDNLVGANGISDADINNVGGQKTSHVMRTDSVANGEGIARRPYSDFLTQVSSTSSSKSNNSSSSSSNCSNNNNSPTRAAQLVSVGGFAAGSDRDDVVSAEGRLNYVPMDTEDVSAQPVRPPFASVGKDLLGMPLSSAKIVAQGAASTSTAAAAVEGIASAAAIGQSQGLIPSTTSTGISKLSAFAGFFPPVAKLPTPAAAVAPEHSSSSAVEAPAAIAGSRAAQEALDRAMMSARYTDTTGLESAIKMARKKGVTVNAAEARLGELRDEKRRLVAEDVEKERPIDTDGMLSGPKVSQLRNTFDGMKSPDRIVPPPPPAPLESYTLPSSSSSSSSSPATTGMTTSSPRVKVPGGPDMEITDKRRDVFSLFC